jgi:hypothetical protein
LIDSSSLWSGIVVKKLGENVSDFVKEVLDMYMWKIIENNSGDKDVKYQAAQSVKEAGLKAGHTYALSIYLMKLKE